MGLGFIATARNPFAGLLMLWCVAVVLLAACGDTRPPPTVVPPLPEAATPDPTAASAPRPTAALTPTPVPTASPTPKAVSVDWAALVAFYESAGGDKWTRSDNWLSDAPVGEWYGVTADDGDRVTELVLGEERVGGEYRIGVRPAHEADKVRASWGLDAGSDSGGVGRTNEPHCARPIGEQVGW